MQKIKTKWLPFYKRFARYYDFFKYFILSMVTLVIAIVILSNGDQNGYEPLILVPVIALFTFSFVKLWQHIVAGAKFKLWAKEQGATPNHVSEYTGAPGTGKTLVQNLSTYYMSKHSWEVLQLEYWLLIPKLRKKNYVPTEDEEEIIQAYNFYVNNPGIPCLSSNVPIYSYEYRRYCYELKAEHLKQEQRVPFRLVGAIDEIGTVCNMELYKDRSDNYGGSADMSDFFRFCRQHVEMRMIGTEQEASNVFKDVRRVTAEVKKFKGVTPCLKPIFFSWLYEVLKKYFIYKASDRQSIMYSRFMLSLKRFLDNAGFLKIKYVYLSETVDENGKQTFNERGKKNGKDFTMYVPCAMPIKYNSRAFKSSYKALGKDIRLACFLKLGLAKDDASRMLKAETLRKINEERKLAKQKSERESYLEKQRLKEEMRQDAKTSKRSADLDQRNEGSN